MNGETVFFLVMAPIMVLAALGLVFTKKAVHAALCMVLTMVCLGIVYFALDAPFLGGVQIFVYTGAVMMLFLFVLMVLGVDAVSTASTTMRVHRVAGIGVALGLGLALGLPLAKVSLPESAGLGVANKDGNMTGLAKLIFVDYLIAFEVTGALLITAAVSAIVLAHRERLVPRATQRELSQHRIAHGPVKAPLPAPGVYARHNSVDVPAQLPDGTASAISVPLALVERGQVDQMPTNSGDDQNHDDTESNDNLAKRDQHDQGERS